MIVNKPTKKKPMSRYTVLCIIFGIILGSIVLRLLFIQIINHEEYKEKANTTSTRFVSETAPRGEIVDKNGVVLATNKRTYSLTYTETEKVNKQFYSSMTELFKILEENGESIQDTMLLKIDDNNKIYFQFASSDKETQNYSELRFKKDRGFDEEVKRKLYPKQEGDLTEEQSNEIDRELLNITPEETFYKLVKNYKLIELVDPDYKSTKEKEAEYKEMTGEDITNKILNAGYSLHDIRQFMLVKDTIKIQNLKGNKTITIANNINKDTVLVIKQKLTDLPGIDVSSVPIRYYPNGNLGSSVLGYVSSITSSEEAKYSLRGYDASTDLIGKSGIEAAFEDQLKGSKGGTTVKVNSSGRVTEKLFELESYPGNNVHLTIDSEIQRVSEEALKDTIFEIQNKKDNSGHTYKNATRGALVSVNVKTGEILSLVSYPDYDPNLFTIPGNLTPEQNKQFFAPDYEEFGTELIKKMGLKTTVDKLFPNGQDNNDLYARPFYNYATMSLIPPGSTFKPLTGVAGLQEKVITPTSTIYDGGKFNNHPELFNDATAPKCLLFQTNGIGHGSIDIAKALEVSCNIYFYETGYRLYQKAVEQGQEKTEALNALAQYAWKFGLGVDPNSKSDPSTGIEIQENFGQTYNFTSWKNQCRLYSKFEIVEYLESGDYRGTGYTYIPFDIRKNEDDNDQVKDSKEAIKDKIDKVLLSVGTNDFPSNRSEFEAEVKKEVKNIIKYSDTYKSRVKEYEERTGKKADLDNQANILTTVISKFAFDDKAAEIKTPAQIVYSAIGQGMNNFTPLQLLSYVSTIANGGDRYKLHLVDKVTDNDGNIIQEFKPEVLNSIDITPANLEAIKNGMSRVNNDDSGTAAAAFQGFPISTGGKTGTADFAENQYERGRAPYATYISFAPLDDPEIAVVAVVFDGGHGGYVAGAVRSVYEAYFKDRLLAENPNYTSPSFQKYLVKKTDEDSNDKSTTDLKENESTNKKENNITD